jgi:hypothetical protein
VDIEAERDPPSIEQAEDQPPRSSLWRFPHPARGTCIPSCTSYGRCHCGCGSRPKLSEVTSTKGHRVAGRPFTFVSGHQMRVAHPHAGIWSRNGVPVEKIRPLLFWLRERHGSIRAVATLLQIPEATIRGYVYNTKRKRVPPEAARRIVALVLAHRKSVGLLDMWGGGAGGPSGDRSPPVEATLGRRPWHLHHGREVIASCSRPDSRGERS